MSKAVFPFEESRSKIFGKIHRPIAEVRFWSNRLDDWLKITLIIDTGADYTILPLFYAEYLGINLKTDCKVHTTYGIGGHEKVFLLRDALIRLGPWECQIPVGFISNPNIPPLLGRQKCIEIFSLTLLKHRSRFVKA